ncbi:MAG: Htur_1727 family rSAM-partnered candidate RiPP [Halorientalis sp.]
MGAPVSECGDVPRATTDREWELFVREATDDPLRHAGSVTAPTAAVAREEARQLFGWAATDLWLCPADETERLAPER